MRGNQVNFIVTQTKSSRPPLFQEDPLPRVPPSLPRSTNNYRSFSNDKYSECEGWCFFFFWDREITNVILKMNHIRFSRLHLPSVVLSVFWGSVGFPSSSRIKKVKKKKRVMLGWQQFSANYHKAVAFFNWPVFDLLTSKWNWTESRHKHCNWVF